VKPGDLLISNLQNQGRIAKEEKSMGINSPEGILKAMREEVNTKISVSLFFILIKWVYFWVH
jgi:hypothetical protein